MATKTTEYATGVDGAEALVKDITEMFDWDKVESPDSMKTIFKKIYGDKGYVGLQVLTQSNAAPQVQGISHNGASTYTTPHTSNYLKYAALACGNGFFALCGSYAPLPSSNEEYCMFVGISTCTNLLTGDTGYCAFEVDDAHIYCLSKDSQGARSLALHVTADAIAGAAISIHEPSTANVSDKILVLTAIPDKHYACLEKVSFNGIPYTRLGRLLVPTE